MAFLLETASILIPILAGAAMYFMKGLNRRQIYAITMTVTCITSAVIFVMLFSKTGEELRLFSITPALAFVIRPDGLGRFFLGIISALWPLTVLYAFSYMEHEKHILMFFSFFTMSYGVTAGIAMSGNIFTMYCFYEFLTLATAPLVIQPMTRASIRATKAYFLYSLGGASLGFASMIFVMYAGAGDFAGNVIGSGASAFIVKYAPLFYFLGFMGLGVKAAVFPLYRWLPMASVAPTPVTALLHAVAVVKAGAFAVIRLTYYCFGPELVQGTWGQYAAMMFAAFTIFYGSALALKETHFKLRMAYSTVDNLSYILFAAALMTPMGLTGGLLHMAAHACIKILAFFCVGAVMHMTGRTSIYELEGIGYKMPLTFAGFTLSALALSGIPPFNGFVSKWYILTASAAEGSIFAYIGAAMLLISALLTAIYMFTIVRRAFYHVDGAEKAAALSEVREADWRMTAVILFLGVATLVLGIFSQPILDAALSVAAEVIR